jgi:predicted short-subunit dehydrogenase-like oxidoreductase (DUF2520 family)
MPHINIIGCGKVGKTLGKLLLSHGAVSSVTVVNTTPESSLRAAHFIGDADTTQNIADLPPASLWMIAAPDKDIPAIANELAYTPSLESHATVFHCAGAKDSTSLSALRIKTERIGSLHLIRSFADPAHAVQSFKGTFCGIEGSPSARSLLEETLTHIGAKVFEISPNSKALCHIGHTFASNYLVVILDCARRLYAEAGIPEAIASQFMKSIIEGTLQNVYSLGTITALTGPVVRGEADLISDHLATITSLSQLLPSDLQDLYRTLARGALAIAKERNELPPHTIESLRAILDEPE